MANIWEKWDKNIDLAGLKDDIKSVEENKSEFREVPAGKYEVKFAKFELKESKKGAPMLSCWMKVIEGEYKNSLIFYNQLLNTGVGIHSANQFLRSLDTSLEIKFDDFRQYNDLIMDIAEAIEAQGLEYLINYAENSKGFKTYAIEDVFGTD